MFNLVELRYVTRQNGCDLMPPRLEYRSRLGYRGYDAQTLTERWSDWYEVQTVEVDTRLDHE